MAKQTSMAGDQPGSAPAGEASHAPAATATPPGPGAVPAAPAAAVDDVASLKAQLAEAQAATDAKIQAAVNAAVAAAMAGRPLPNDREPTAEQLLAKMDRERLEREAANAKIDEWLASGPLQFDISMTNEARMNRRVGGVSQDEAQAKYMRYFGITAIVDPNKRIGVSQVAPAAPEPAKVG